MELTVDFETGVIEQIKNDPAFANALLLEVEDLLLNSDSEPVQGMLRVLVHGTVGLTTLAESLSMTRDSLQQLFSQDATPDAASLSAVEKALRLALGVAAS